tara:strand:- start:90 stop:497 length:408 start_codon:yes stop_codon:yes gene_type:complete
MADDMTKQEILFYTLIASNPEGVSEDDIFTEMGSLAEKAGWPAYLDAVPRALEERIKNGEAAGHIQLCRPLTWQPKDAEQLKRYIGHLVIRYLAENTDAQARNALGEKLGIDFSEALHSPSTPTPQAHPLAQFRM